MKKNIETFSRLWRELKTRHFILAVQSQCTQRAAVQPQGFECSPQRKGKQCSPKRDAAPRPQRGRSTPPKVCSTPNRGALPPFFGAAHPPKLYTISYERNCDWLLCAALRGVFAQALRVLCARLCAGALRQLCADLCVDPCADPGSGVLVVC